MAINAMRILLTGKAGQVGSALLSCLPGDVYAPGKDELDLSRPESIARLIREFRPSVIINPAAYTAVDLAESDREAAFAVNGLAPGIMGEEARLLDAVVMHFSTDYVFGGTKSGAYSENDAPDPLNYYGYSKLEGENALRQSGARHFVLRTSWVISPTGRNFVKTIMRKASEQDHLQVVSDQQGVPTSSFFLAKMTQHVLQCLIDGSIDGSDLGTYHIVPCGKTSWHGVARRIVETALANGAKLKTLPSAIESISSADYRTEAQRPLNSVLATEKFRRVFGVDLPRWEQGVDDVVAALLGRGTCADSWN